MGSIVNHLMVGGHICISPCFSLLRDVVNQDPIGACCVQLLHVASRHHPVSSFSLLDDYLVLSISLVVLIDNSPAMLPLSLSLPAEHLLLVICRGEFLQFWRRLAHAVADECLDCIALLTLVVFICWSVRLRV